MISLYHTKDDCCGCTACASICPQKAIYMHEDSEGFKYPVIDERKCINCMLCKKVCAFQNGYDTAGFYGQPYVYAVKHKNNDIRMSSTSGGAFTAISDYILDNHGVVYGVKFDENMNVVHARAESEKERNEFKGSKYVQSDMSDICRQVAEDLSSNKSILFTGTPCQCAGIINYLNIRKISTEKLVVCDIVCHGTPSPMLWKNHINLLERKGKSKVKNYYCRSKVRGWHGHNEMVVYENNKTDYQSRFSQEHKNIFYSHNTLRPSCHNCKYTNLQRCSDITIADFWGVEKSMLDFDDNKGISLVLINNNRGEKVFDSIKLKFDYRQNDVDSCLQPQLQHPAVPSPKRDEFWNDYYSKGYLYVVKKYAKCGLKPRMRSIIIKTLKVTGLYDAAKIIFKRG